MKKIKLVGDNVCMKCGGVLKSETKEFCTDCIKKKKSFTQGKGIYQYTGPMKNAMYKFKYANRRCYGDVFAKHAKIKYANYIKNKNIEAIIPVPMNKRKQRKRGYNQAEVFANCLGREFDIPVYADYLCRTRDTNPLKMLNPLERSVNLQNAFKLSDNSVKLKKVLVVDDIYTTGSTMEAVSKVLLDSGIREIYCMSICIGEDVSSF